MRASVCGYLSAGMFVPLKGMVLTIMRNKNISSALVLIAFGILYGILTANLPDRTLPNTPSPSFFPWIITSVVLILSMWLLVRGIRQPKTDGDPVDVARLRVAACAMVSFLGYVVAMPFLGFVLATVPFFVVMMLLYGEKRPLWVGGGAIGTTVFLYVVFRHGFGVFLPQGLLRGIVT